MPTVRIPVLLCRDRLGQSVAQMVGGGPEACAAGDSDRAAIDRLKDYLEFLCKTGLCLSSDLGKEPQLSTFRISVRGEYRVASRVYPCEDVFPLHVHCVSGRQEQGPFVAHLPLLGISFYYFEGDSLKELVARYVQETLKGLTPAQLASLLPPHSLELRSIAVRVPSEPAESKAAIDTPELQRVAESLDDRLTLRRFGKAWERDAEIESLAALLRKSKSHLLLVGDPGVGKTAVLIAAIKHLQKPDVSRKKPEPPASSETEKEIEKEKPPKTGRFWMTSGHRLIAGMRYLGQWQERCENVISELADVHGVLCIENLSDLVRLGGCEPTESLASFFLPYLQRSEMRMVAECAPHELDACRRLLPSLLDAFEVFHVPKLTPARAVALLDRQASQLDHERQVRAQAGLTAQVERLFRRFQPHQAFPGGAVSFLNDLATQAVRGSRSTGRARQIEVTIDDAIQLFRRRTGLPELFLRDELPLQEAEVLGHMESRINGQPEACRLAADTILTFKAGLNDPRRPLRVLLFCGPTGVGKTETAKAIADYLFGHGDRRERMLRLDLSEYGGFDGARRLLEGADGEPSSLIQSIRRQPLAVLLLDEIEKAASSVFDVLLGLLDEGRLTDRFGRVTDFRSCIIVLTSNLGADVRQGVGFGGRSDAPYERAIRSFFRPEFFNRLDAVVQFHPLDESALRQIVLRELDAISRREGLSQRRIRLTWSDDLVDAAIHRGCDNRYGARPLQRFLERTVVGPLSLLLNENPGWSDRTMTVSWVGDAATFFQR